MCRMQPCEQHGNIAAMMSDIENADARIERITTAVWGNGKPGLISDVQSISQRITDMQNDVTELKQDAKGRNKLLIATLLSSLGSTIMLLLGVLVWLAQQSH